MTTVAPSPPPELERQDFEFLRTLPPRTVGHRPGRGQALPGRLPSGPGRPALRHRIDRGDGPPDPSDPGHRRRHERHRSDDDQRDALVPRPQAFQRAPRGADPGRDRTQPGPPPTLRVECRRLHGAGDLQRGHAAQAGLSRARGLDLFAGRDGPERDRAREGPRGPVLDARDQPGPPRPDADPLLHPGRSALRDRRVHPPDGLVLAAEPGRSVARAAARSSTSSSCATCSSISTATPRSASSPSSASSWRRTAT